jgi:hypothetical protein
MRVLIQNCLSHKFLSPKKTWVSNPEEAEDFEKTLRAWTEIDERKLSGVRIVLNLGSGIPDVALASVGTEHACGRGLIQNPNGGGGGFRTIKRSNPFREEKGQ